jgi:type IV fimbrial biogenesis protein FimT
MIAGTDRMPRSFTPSGFTLLELMVTIAILAIVAALGTPSLANIIRDNRVTAQANDLVSLLTLARSEAVKRRNNAFVVVDSPNNVGWRGRVCITNNCSGTEDPLRLADFDGTPITLSAPVTIVFTEMGRVTTATSLGFQHEPCNQQQRRTVTVAGSGHVEIARTGCQ